MKHPTQEQKKEYLISKGWKTLWNENNWIHYGIMSGANIDCCGLNIEDAYQCQMKQKNN
ncbi:hypothetical protein [Tenacibaculum sp. 190524A02b]|uniref:hypothetical protein n=1 Tax=Tenacibaculum vairaonense TaxID=3137860 RepID=UPI0031FB3D51